MGNVAMGIFFLKEESLAPAHSVHTLPASILELFHFPHTLESSYWPLISPATLHSLELVITWNSTSSVFLNATI